MSPTDAGHLLGALADAKDGHAIGRLAQMYDAEAWTRALLIGGALLPKQAVRALAVELALREKPLVDPRLLPLLAGEATSLSSLERLLPGGILHFSSVPGSTRTQWSPPEPVPADWLSVADFAVVRVEHVDPDGGSVGPLAAAVRPWAAHSNGEIEVCEVALDGAVGLHVPESFLRALGLRMALPRHTVTVTPIMADAALGDLFCAAHGGAYGPRRSDAEARDLAWENLRALLDMAPDAPLTQVEAAARRCGFTRIYTSCFNGVFWDVGLAVVDATAGRLVVLLATDTD